MLTEAVANQTQVSVVMAVYQGVAVEHLTQALDSLSAQTLSPNEVVVVADGPLTPGLERVLDSASETLPLRMVRLPENLGSGPAKQCGLAATSNELVAIADADDVSVPERLECQAQLMATGIDVLGSAVEEFDAQTGEVLGRRVMPTAHEDIARRMSIVIPLNHPSVMLRRSVALRAGGYDALPYLEDYDLLARLISRGARFANSEEVLVRFRGGTAAQRRRRAPGSFRVEWKLQRRLYRYGIVSRPQAVFNWVVRCAFRMLPGGTALAAYKRLFLRSVVDSPAARPMYDEYREMSAIRAPLAGKFANQVLSTLGIVPDEEPFLRVLDVGSGYGDTAMAMADRVAHVTCLEPAEALHLAAERRAQIEGRSNMKFINAGVEALEEEGAYDVVVLDNVYEHLPDQQLALAHVSRSLKDGGLLYLLVPNKAWPIEAHYDLLGLSWLPLPLANAYLRLTRRGTDYTDASYAPTYHQLTAALERQGDFEFAFTLPADPTATVAGLPVHYRLGMALISRFPSLWAISKALLVVAERRPRT